MTGRDCSLLVQAGILVTDPRELPGVIRDAAVCINGDRIVAVGPYPELARAFTPRQQLGGPDALVVPGLINAHDHGRAPSALQLGIADDLLEAWLVDLLRLPAVDTRDATSYAALEQLENGITTTSNSFYLPANYRAELEATAAGYRAAGLRVGLVASTLDQSPVVELLTAVAPQLTPALRRFVGEFMARRRPPDQTDYFATLQDYPACAGDHRQWLLAGPVSLHWCSQPLLAEIWAAAARRDLSLQTHLLESPYQAATATARHGQSIVSVMQQQRLLQSNLSCAHCVYLSAPDMALLANAGVSVVHNASSNLRLRNGVAPVQQMLAEGINVALGLDSQSLNDDADMWQEMRLVARLHQAQGQGLDSRQVWAMATINGARALGIEDLTGSLAVGKKADLLLLDGSLGRADWLPLVATEQPLEQVFDRLVLLCDKTALNAVIVDGEIMQHEGRHCRLDKLHLGHRLRDQLAEQSQLLREDFGQQIAALKPALRRFIASVAT